MNRTLFRDFLTGLTSLLGLVGLIVMLMLFGELNSVVERNYSFQVTVSNAGGLAETSPVTLDGVKIGRVNKLESVQGVGARMTLQVREGVRIPRRASVSIDRGFVGDATMEFKTVGLPPADLADVINKGDIVEAGSPDTLLGTLQTIVKEPIDRLTKAADSIDKLAGEYQKLGEKLNDLVEPRTLADVEAGKAPNLRSTLARMDKALVDADSWLGDTELRLTAKQLLERAGKVVDQTQELTNAWTNAAKKVETTVGDIGGRADEISAEFKDLSAKAQDVLGRAQAAADGLALNLEKVNKGDGTVGRLMNDPALYENLNEAADRLDTVLQEAQQLIGKYKAEGIRLKLWTGSTARA